MSKKDFMIALSHIDDRILDRYLQEDTRLSAPIPFVKRPWVRLAALAACLALITTGIFLLLPPATNEPTISMTVTMDDVLSVMPSTMDGTPTTSYSQITLPNGECPDYMPLVQQDTLPVYKNNRIHVPIYEPGFSLFADKTLNSLAAVLGTADPQYTITNNTDTSDDLFSNAYLRGRGTLGDFNVSLYRSGSMYSLSIYTNESYFYTNGQAICIDPRLDDAQILSALGSANQNLLDIFDGSYSDAIVLRSNQYIDVYFYDGTDPVNEWAMNILQEQDPIINYTRFCFYLDSESVSYCTGIHHTQSLVDSNAIYSSIDMPMRTLEEAEEWLNMGYVFGGGPCPKCMELQTPVDFENYDYVGIQYRYCPVFLSGGSLGMHVNVAIPFYVFYKAIETTDTTITYAYTYVLAVEIDGTEEYFAEKYSHHES